LLSPRSPKKVAAPCEHDAALGSRCQNAGDAPALAPSIGVRPVDLGAPARGLGLLDAEYRVGLAGIAGHEARAQVEAEQTVRGNRRIETRHEVTTAVRHG